MANNIISIPTIISSIIQMMRDNGDYSNDAPYFDFGNHTYIANVLMNKANSTSHYNKVFPFVGLILDIPEDRNQSIEVYGNITFTIVLSIMADMNKSNIQREQTSFINVLYPLYEDLLNQMYNSHYFKISEGNSGLYIPHKKTDMYYYDSNEGRNKWNAKVDAIELIFNNLNLNRKTTC